MSAFDLSRSLLSQAQAQAPSSSASAPQALVLRDIHEPPPTSWWPPAPGWWMVMAVLVATALMYFVRRFLHRRYLRRCERMFDEAVAAAPTGPARVAAISELLRRAARRRHPAADRLEGDAWLGFLEGAGGAPFPGFVDGPGRGLLDGPFRPTIGAAELDALHALARARFLDLMQARR